MEVYTIQYEFKAFLNKNVVDNYGGRFDFTVKAFSQT